MIKYTELIWDFDGTLADSYPAITRASMKALAEQGVTPPYEEAYGKCKRSLAIMQDWYCARYPLDRKALRKGYGVHSGDEGLSALPLFDGVAEALRALKEAGCRHFLYTHRGPRAWDALAYHGIARLFSGGVDGGSGFPNKPAPDALKYIISVYSLNPARCLMLGDRDIDMDAAKNAGVACALFDPDKYYPDCETDLSYADYPGLLKTLGM